MAALRDPAAVRAFRTGGNKVATFSEPSPKGLGWPAHEEKEGKRRYGTDGAIWVAAKRACGSLYWQRAVPSFEQWIKMAAGRRAFLRLTAVQKVPIGGKLAVAEALDQGREHAAVRRVVLTRIESPKKSSDLKGDTWVKTAAGFAYPFYDDGEGYACTGSGADRSMLWDKFRTLPRYAPNPPAAAMKPKKRVR